MAFGGCVDDDAGQSFEITREMVTEAMLVADKLGLGVRTRTGTRFITEQEAREILEAIWLKDNNEHPTR